MSEGTQYKRLTFITDGCSWFDGWIDTYDLRFGIRGSAALVPIYELLEAENVPYRTKVGAAIEITVGDEADSLDSFIETSVGNSEKYSSTCTEISKILNNSRYIQEE